MGEHQGLVQLLAPDGTLDPTAKQLLDPAQLVEGYRLMVLSRALDDRGVALHRQGRLNIHAPSRGQEAAVVGSALAIDPSLDWVVPQYREVAAEIRQGLTLRSFWHTRMGIGSQGSFPEGINLMPMQIAIAAQMPHITGLAYGLRLQGTHGVVLGYVGEGGASEGDFHESLNFAGVLDAPAVFVCINNNWAISTSFDRQTAATRLADRAAGYGMPGEAVDGNDLFAVYEATRRAVDRARAGDGPTLIEAVSYRMGMHNTTDDPSRYMANDEVDEWAAKDPIARLRAYLIAEDVAGADDLDAMDAAVQAEVDDSVDDAERAARDIDPVALMFDNVFAELPRRTATHRAEAARGGHHG